MENLNFGETIYGIGQVGNTTTATAISKLQNLTNLTVITKVENNCAPKVFCGGMKARDFQVRIFEIQDDKPEPVTLIKSFPGSSQGWKLTFSRPIQYDIQLFNPPLGKFVTIDLYYSSGCHGYLSVQESYCVTNARLTNTMVGNKTIN